MAARATARHAPAVAPTLQISVAVRPAAVVVPVRVRPLNVATTIAVVGPLAAVVTPAMLLAGATAMLPAGVGRQRLGHAVDLQKKHRHTHAHTQASGVGTVMSLGGRAQALVRAAPRHGRRVSARTSSAVGLGVEEQVLLLRAQRSAQEPWARDSCAAIRSAGRRAALVTNGVRARVRVEPSGATRTSAGSRHQGRRGARR